MHTKLWPETATEAAAVEMEVGDASSGFKKKTFNSTYMLIVINRHKKARD
jgi:hypothetical protein